MKAPKNIFLLHHLPAPAILSDRSTARTSKLNGLYFHGVLNR